MAKTYKVRSKVILWPGEQGAWHFAHVDKKLSEELHGKYGRNHRGFGSIRVRVTIGKTTWDTSIFPDTRSGTYLLPLKAKVRSVEGIQEGDAIVFVLEVIM